MAGAAWVASLSARQSFALSRTDAVFASGYRDRDGGFGIAVLAEDGTIIDRTPLPARSHGMAFSPAIGHLVAFGMVIVAVVAGAGVLEKGDSTVLLGVGALAGTFVLLNGIYERMRHGIEDRVTEPPEDGGS